MEVMNDLFDDFTYTYKRRIDVFVDFTLKSRSMIDDSPIFLDTYIATQSLSIYTEMSLRRTEILEAIVIYVPEVRYLH